MRPKLHYQVWQLRGPSQNRFFVYSHRSHVHHNILYRPQLTFLNPSSARYAAQSLTHLTQRRWLTTETKRWIGSELKKAVRWALYGYTFLGLGLVMAFGINQERLERLYHSPEEWTFTSRQAYRLVRKNKNRFEELGGIADWSQQASYAEVIIKRCEDPESTEGAGVKAQVDGGIFLDGVEYKGFDVTAKSEPWRRGYYDMLLQSARAAEHLDEWVRDTTQELAFPKNTVIGPSNPNPRPLPVGHYTAPREENCKKAWNPPEPYYLKIMTTKGFTPKQKLDAALGYASWLEFKGTSDAATEWIKWALNLVSSAMVFDKTGQLNPKLPVSSNLLDATTAMAIHQAKNKNLDMALPLFLSLLRARRSLPEPPPAVVENAPPVTEMSKFKEAFALVNSAIISIFKTPIYPPAPPDGTELPFRDDRNICEEAGLMLYIGEIIYSTSKTQKAKEEGLAWTREAVDTTEDTIRHLRPDETKTSRSCKQCLETAFENWSTMVSMLAAQEREAREAKKEENAKAWLWRGEVQEGPGRWESEEAVVKDRITRATTTFGLSGKLVTPGESSLFFL